MARVSSADRVAEIDAAARVRRTSWPRAIGFAAAAAAVVLAAFLAHPLLEGFRLPVGPDGPVYVWRTQYATATGLSAVPGSRPGVHGLLVMLGDVLGTEPVETVTVVGPVLAAACGLAAAALLEAALGANLLRAGAAAVLAGAFAAWLAGGWLANLAMATLFLAALAALALARRSWRAVGAGGALLAAAALTHWTFLLIGLLVIGGIVAAHLPEGLRERRDGRRARDTAAFRIGLAGAAGAGAGFIGLLPGLGAVRVPGDTAQDGFFRRYGLRDLLLARYRERFAGDLTRLAAPLVSGTALGLAGLGLSGRPASRGTRYLASLSISWAAVTAVGIAVLGITGWGPPNRLLLFAFFLPVAAAGGLAVLSRRGRLALAGGVVAAGAFASVAMGGWYRHSPSFSPEELGMARQARGTVARLEPGTPLVFLVDTREDAAAFHITRFGNVIRMGLPPGRIPDSRLAVGAPEDFLAGRPTLTGDPEHDRLSRAYLREAEPVRDRAMVMVLEPFNPDGYGEAVVRGDEVAPGIAVLSAGSEGAAPATAGPPGIAEGLGPGAQVGLAIAALILLAVAGGGWAGWALPGAGPRAVAALAPSAGVGVAVLGTVAADLLGAPAGGPWFLVAVGVLGAAGYGVAWRAANSG